MKQERISKTFGSAETFAADGKSETISIFFKIIYSFRRDFRAIDVRCKKQKCAFSVLRLLTNTVN